MISNPVGEILQTIGGVAEVDGRRVIEKIVVADIVAAVVSAELQVVFAAVETVIIDELILRDIAPLRDSRAAD